MSILVPLWLISVGPVLDGSFLVYLGRTRGLESLSLTGQSQMSVTAPGALCKRRPLR